MLLQNIPLDYLVLDQLQLYLSDTGAPPANAVLLCDPGDGSVWHVTDVACRRGWEYRQLGALLHAVHRQQWGKRRGPVYFRPRGNPHFWKADLDVLDDAGPYFEPEG